MRAGLVLVVLAAVVVPTAVLGNAPAAGPAFSVQQVLRVFETEGIALHRQPDYLVASFQGFDAAGAGNRFDLSVMVWRPGVSAPTERAYVSLGGVPPRFAHRGNVNVVLSGLARVPRVWAKVRRALQLLRYSPADSSRPPLPTFVLRAGEHRTLTAQEAPNGSEVACTNGRLPTTAAAFHPQPLVAATVIAASTRRSASLTASTTVGRNHKPRSAQLGWTPHAHGAVEFSCSAKLSGGTFVSPPLGSAYGVVKQGWASVIPPPPSVPAVTGPLPRLRLRKPNFTLRNEYANVPARTLRAMLGR